MADTTTRKGAFKEGRDPRNYSNGSGIPLLGVNSPADASQQASSLRPEDNCSNNGCQNQIGSVQARAGDNRCYLCAATQASSALRDRETARAREIALAGGHGKPLEPRSYLTPEQIRSMRA